MAYLSPQKFVWKSCTEEGRPIKIAMVLTMTMRGTVIARHVREQLGEVGYPLLKGEMLNRVAYPEAGIEGLSPSIRRSSAFGPAGDRQGRSS